MFWKKKKMNTPETDADIYADALNVAFRVPKAAPVPMPKEVKPRRSAPKWLRPAAIGLAVLCLVATVLIWALARRPSRETEHYLRLTVMDTSDKYLYGVDDADVYWRIDPGPADLDMADAERGDMIWVFYNGEGKEIDIERDSARYTRAVTARDVHLCCYDEPPASLAKYGMLFDTVRFDIDGDGLAETCRLFSGPTSGMRTYSLVAFNSFGLAEKQVIFYAPNAEWDPAFYVKDRALQILYATMPFASVPDVQRPAGAWDVRLENGQIALYAGNKQLDRIIDGELVRGTEIPTIPNLTAVNFKIYQNPAAGTSPFSASENLELSHSEADALVNRLRGLSWGSAEGQMPIGEITVYVGGSTFVYQFTPYGVLLCGGQAAQCPQQIWDELMAYLAALSEPAEYCTLQFKDLFGRTLVASLSAGHHTMAANGTVSTQGICSFLGSFVVLSFADTTELLILRRDGDHMVFLQAYSGAYLALAEGTRLPVSNGLLPPVGEKQGKLAFSLQDPSLYMGAADPSRPAQETPSAPLTLSVEDSALLESLFSNIHWTSQSFSSQAFTPVGTLYWTYDGFTEFIDFEADGTLLWEGNYATLPTADWGYIWSLLLGLGKSMPETGFSADDLTLRFHEGGLATLENDGIGTTVEYLRCGDRVLVKNNVHWLLLNLSTLNGKDRLKLVGIGDTPAGLFSGALDEIVPTLQLWLPGADPELMPPEVILSRAQEQAFLEFLSHTFADANPERIVETDSKAILRGNSYTYGLFIRGERNLTWAFGNEGVTKQLTVERWQEFLQLLYPASEQFSSRVRSLTEAGFQYIDMSSDGSAKVYDASGQTLKGRWIMANGLLYISAVGLIPPGGVAERTQIFVFRYEEERGYIYLAGSSNQDTWNLTDGQLFEVIYFYG